ncbi:hypothetical protein GCM10007301_26050 [Azorhizobium oxalatiphilum]|uniref:Uncharacterized protein n=1 Tax=Azorhizobium oxalatiphilum TaxID=980631 RepID=A0A917BZG9_9HYPH|nr:hypothetical protein [Azorhizobium oxalatiphilum]GGF65026.1 hypothetical protein GCM10007301_26050 [Azorhizobium oxalatiphilum]
MRIEILLTVVAFLGVAIIWGIIYLSLRNRLARAKGNLLVQRGDTVYVPLVAAFSGWKGLPWLSWSHSNIGPRLALHPEHVECKVVWRRRKPYSRIALVDYRRTIGTENVVLTFTDSISSFTGNTANRFVAREAIRSLRDHGCTLSDRAAKLLAEADDAGRA